MTLTDRQNYWLDVGLVFGAATGDADTPLIDRVVVPEVAGRATMMWPMAGDDLYSLRLDVQLGGAWINGEPMQTVRVGVGVDFESPLGG